MKELFRQLRCGIPWQYIDLLEKNSSQFLSRWNLKGRLSCNYNRTVLKKNSLETILQKAYNCLKFINFHQKAQKIEPRSDWKVRKHCVVDNGELSSILFGLLGFNIQQSMFFLFELFNCTRTEQQIVKETFFVPKVFLQGGDSKSNQAPS